MFVPDSKLCKRVHESLDSAEDNGYMLDLHSVDDIANDLHEYDADLEDVEPDDLRPYVISWKLAKTIKRDLSCPRQLTQDEINSTDWNDYTIKEIDFLISCSCISEKDMEQYYGNQWWRDRP